MHLSYEKQLVVKQQRVIDALQRIGKIDDVAVQPCIPSPDTLSYRNKIQLPVRQRDGELILGLYARSSHDLVEVNTCLIHGKVGEEVYGQVRGILKDSGIVAYNPSEGTGELRHVIIKSASQAQEALVVLVTNQAPTPLLKQITQRILKASPAVKGVVHNLNTGKDNVILGSKYTVLEGSGSIQETLCGLKFNVSPASFPGQSEASRAPIWQGAGVCRSARRRDGTRRLLWRGDACLDLC